MGKPRCKVRRTSNISSLNPNYNCHYNTTCQSSRKSKLQDQTQHPYFAMRRLSSFVGSMSVVVLMLLLTMLILPTVDTGVSATDNWSQVATTFNAKVNPSISVSVPSSFNLNLAPSSQSTFAVADGKVAVMTNNASGYRVLIQSTTGSSLVSRDSSSEQAIASINNHQTEAEFENNTWGYYLGSAAVDSSSVYQPVSTTATEAIKTTGLSDTANTTYYNLAFGTKIAASLPAGTYSNAIVVSAVANPLEVHSLMDLTFMQDMTSSICESTPSAYSAETNTTDTSSEYYKNPVSKQLIDLRDGKSYWVAKLADGNCWMTQNLALDLDPAKTLTSADTDLPSGESWTPEVGTNEAKLEGTSFTANLSNSWSFGEIIVAAPAKSTGCTEYGKSQYDEAFSAKTGDNLGETCAEIGAVNVSNWQPNFTAQTGSYSYDSNTGLVTSEPDISGTTLVTANTTNETYDAHYLIGNFYRSYAATAGSAASVTTDLTDAPSSICARGWRLPSLGKTASGDNINKPLESNEFYHLLLMYGYPSLNSYMVVNNSALTPIKNREQDVPSNLMAPPLSIVATSGYPVSTGYLTAFGASGRLLSGTMQSPEVASFASMTTWNVWPAEIYSFNTIGNVRCVAR